MLGNHNLNPPRRAKIIGLGKGVPANILTNQDLERLIDTTDEWITTRTGVKERRIVSPQQSTNDLAEEASRQALQASGLNADDLELIILCTVAPDQYVPAGACDLQYRLGARQAAAFDLNAACSGFLFGLSVAQAFVAAQMFSKILVVGAEALSRLVDYQDRSTCIIFGDGAGAAVVAASDDETGILGFDMGADGSGGSLLQIPGGGTKIPASHASVDQKLHYIRMKGKELFRPAVRAMLASMDRALASAQLSRQDIDWVIPHQANMRIIEALAARMNISMDRIFINLNRYGNTSGASIPLALAEAVEQDLLAPGDIVVLAGFGAGLTWGSMIVRWGKLGI